MAFKEPARRVDEAAIKVNQGFIVGLLLLAYIGNSMTLVAFVALVMLLGTIAPELALFQIIYREGLRPARVITPKIVIDNPEPHRFAQGFGGVVVTLGVIALMFNHATVGWALVWLVAVLAALNLALNFCAGCFVYYQLNRLGVPGFKRSPIRVR
jgi:hypothetical protein